jgi:bifunctional non-homologous end joining protein LigD
MALETYRRKRNFRITPEPKGRKPRLRKNGLAFVIQKHAASHLHYDFRLELNGVLLSWAVPKGPSLDPNDKRLAMHVEDHPMEYGEFEGIIPAKQYGGGTVLLWDRGIWLPKEDPVAGYKKGKLKFDLQGEKLHGGWTLVKSRGSKYGGDKAWLLIKEDDEAARRAPDALVVEDKPKSVATGRSIEEIAAERDRVWNSNKSARENVRSGAVKKKSMRSVDPAKIEGAARRAMPAFIEPQLATLVKTAPDGHMWIEEIKFDGYRMLCRIEGGEARLYSRNNKNWTGNFQFIADAAARLPVETAWLDGEVVQIDDQGRSSFQRLQNALSSQDASDMIYFVFDLPYLNGYDLRPVPLLERKRALEAVMASPPAALRLSFHQQGQGAAFFSKACELQLEGMVAKLASSVYSAGRNRSWVKVKCGMRQEMVIGGFTDPAGSRQGLGALLLGVYEAGGQLRYSGKVGTGFSDKSLLDLRKQLDALVQDEPAFFNPPRGAEARRAHWVKPQLVAEIGFTEWTADGTLRHPSFQGLREDKKATDVVRERPAAPPASEAQQGRPRRESGKKAARGRDPDKVSKSPGQRPAKTRAKARDPAKVKNPGKGNQGSANAIGGIELSNPDKPMYPESGITKQDLALYYEAIGDWMVPHVEKRPLSLLRCPNGWGKECFYQKNVDPSTNPVLERIKVSTSDGPATYMMANSTGALIALVQMGVLEIHPWGSTSGKLGLPDRIIFDFDPDDALPWDRLVEAVNLIRTLLDEIGLQGFLKTTGGKGLHVVVPIKPAQPWPLVKGFSKAIADLFAMTFPDRFTAKVSKSTRHGRIFIDYLRNDEGSTAIAPYSTRAREHAPVAVPVGWNELSTDIRFDHFNIKTLPTRLKRLKNDPWAGFFDTRQTISAKMMNKVGFKS